MYIVSLNWGSKFLKRMLFIALILLASCAKFQSNPISSDENASSYQARNLNNPDLKVFMEKNLNHEISPWSPKTWDFAMLTLAAFYYHPDMDVARAQWGTAKAGISTAGGRPNPTLSFTPEFNTNAASGVSPWTLGFSLDIPIETAGKRRYRVAYAKNLSESARLNIASVAWQVRSRLRAALLKFYAANHSETILLEKIATQEEIKKLIERRFRLGEVSSPDITQMRLLFDQTRLSLLEAQKQKAQAHVEIANALGLPVNALEEVDISLDAFDLLPPESELSLKDIRRSALVGRPDILGALAEYQAGEAALRLEIAKQYPDIQLGPGYTYDQGDNKWALGISITVPVFNRNRGPIAEAEARRTEIAARFNALQARIIAENDHALASYRAALKNIEITEALLAEKKKYLESVQASFKAGEVDRLKLLNAQMEYRSVELSRLDAFVAAQESLGLLEDSVQRPLNPLGPFPAVPETNPRAERRNNQ